MKHQAGQLYMALKPDTTRCRHRFTFLSLAYVPAGEVCCDCETLLNQHTPWSCSPEALGYLSATWAWHFIDGKPWLTQDPETKETVFYDPEGTAVSWFK
jgi:hypothetical protein